MPPKKASAPAPAPMSPQKMLATALCVLVAVVVVIGIYMAGSPAKVRREQLDQQRVNTLMNISNAIDTYYESEAKLPATLEELVARSNDSKGYYIDNIVDPVTGETFEYSVLVDAKYELCATFDAPTPEGRDAYGNPRPVPAMEPSVVPGTRVWDHAAGHQCFTLDASFRTPTVACSLTNPCVAPNTTCAQLPGRGTYCIPQGKECEAAGCAGTCSIAESYPSQIRCIDDDVVVPPAHPEPGDEEPTTDRPVTCNLMQSKTSGKMACFGCGTKACVKPGPEWEMYERPEGEMGIPYSCYSDENGFCALAQ